MEPKRGFGRHQNLMTLALERLQKNVWKHQHGRKAFSARHRTRNPCTSCIYIAPVALLPGEQDRVPKSIANVKVKVTRTIRSPLLEVRPLPLSIAKLLSKSVIDLYCFCFLIPPRHHGVSQKTSLSKTPDLHPHFEETCLRDTRKLRKYPTVSAWKE